MKKQSLSRAQRKKLLQELSKKVKKKLHAPRLAAIDWDAIVAQNAPNILDAPDDASFEKAVLEMLKELQSSHTGFYRRDLKHCSAKAVLAASYTEATENDTDRWVFQNVHAGGPADRAGIRPGDILIEIDGQSVHPPEHPTFAVGTTVNMKLQVADGKLEFKQVTIPELKAKWNQLPKVEPDPIVSHKLIDSETGYLKVASYPGQIGVEVANDISTSIKALGAITRLVIDLRGNPGGGIGVLRLMSFLTPERTLVGVNAKGKMNQSVSAVPAGAFVLDAIPDSKAGLLPLVTRYLLRGIGKPVAVLTEGLGTQSFHGRVVLLVDRNTSSANEMLLAFAREHHLATIVGECTPGRVLSGDKFNLSYGYTVALPIAAYQTTTGNSIEGNPIEPDVLVPFDAEAARHGSDPQMDAAVEAVRRL